MHQLRRARSGTERGKRLKEFPGAQALRNELSDVRHRHQHHLFHVHPGRFPGAEIVIRLLLIPVIAGVSYEIIRLAGKSDNKLVNLISKPGLMLQRLTTREPDAEMAEVAIAAVEAVFDWRAYLNENFGYTYPAKTEKKEHEEP